MEIVVLEGKGWTAVNVGRARIRMNSTNAEAALREFIDLAVIGSWDREEEIASLSIELAQRAGLNPLDIALAAFAGRLMGVPEPLERCEAGAEDGHASAHCFDADLIKQWSRTGVLSAGPHKWEGIDAPPGVRGRPFTISIGPDSSEARVGDVRYRLKARALPDAFRELLLAAFTPCKRGGESGRVPLCRSCTARRILDAAALGPIRVARALCLIEATGRAPRPLRQLSHDDGRTTWQFDAHAIEAWYSEVRGEFSVGDHIRLLSAFDALYADNLFAFAVMHQAFDLVTAWSQSRVGVEAGA